jgi:hypothetical protein
MTHPKTQPALVFAAGMTGGTFVAMAAGIVLGRYGVDLFGVWRGIAAVTQAQFRSALAWWTIAGAAFVGGFVIAFVHSRFVWLYARWLRGVLAIFLTIALALLAGAAPTAAGVTPAAYVAANVAALIVAGLMAAFGSYFAVRR